MRTHLVSDIQTVNFTNLNSSQRCCIDIRLFPFILIYLSSTLLFHYIYVSILIVSLSLNDCCNLPHYTCFSDLYKKTPSVNVFPCVLVNIILRRIFGPKRDENGEWRRLQNEELHNLYRSPNIVSVNKSRRLRWAVHVARMEEAWSTFKIITGKPTRKTYRKA